MCERPQNRRTQRLEVPTQNIGQIRIINKIDWENIEDGVADAQRLDPDFGLVIALSIIILSLLDLYGMSIGRGGITNLFLFWISPTTLRMIISTCLDAVACLVAVFSISHTRWLHYYRSIMLSFLPRRAERSLAEAYVGGKGIRALALVISAGLSAAAAALLASNLKISALTGEVNAADVLVQLFFGAILFCSLSLTFAAAAISCRNSFRVSVPALFIISLSLLIFGYIKITGASDYIAIERIRFFSILTFFCLAVGVGGLQVAIKDEDNDKLIVTINPNSKNYYKSYSPLEMPTTPIPTTLYFDMQVGHAIVLRQPIERPGYQTVETRGHEGVPALDHNVLIWNISALNSIIAESFSKTNDGGFFRIAGKFRLSPTTMNAGVRYSSPTVKSINDSIFNNKHVKEFFREQITSAFVNLVGEFDRVMHDFDRFIDEASLASKTDSNDFEHGRQSRDVVEAAQERRRAVRETIILARERARLFGSKLGEIAINGFTNVREEITSRYVEKITNDIIRRNENGDLSKLNVERLERVKREIGEIINNLGPTIEDVKIEHVGDTAGWRDRIRTFYTTFENDYQNLLDRLDEAIKSGDDFLKDLARAGGAETGTSGMIAVEILKHMREQSRERLGGSAPQLNVEQAPRSALPPTEEDDLEEPL